MPTNPRQTLSVLAAFPALMRSLASNIGDGVSLGTLLPVPHFQFIAAIAPLVVA